MNAPLLLTSVALLTGIAARPIDRQHDDIAAQDGQTHNSNRQVYLHNPSSNININSQFGDGLDIETIPHTPVDNAGSASPKLMSSDSAFSDPGLSSPYVGPQRHLAKLQALGLENAVDYDLLSTLSPVPSRPSSPAVQLSTSDNDDVHNSSKDDMTTPSHISLQSDYSPMIAVMIVSSLGALVLLGLVMAAVYVSQLLRLTVLQGNVWRTITKRSEVSTSDKPKVPMSESDPIFSTETHLDEKNAIVLTRQIPSTLQDFHLPSSLSEKNSNADQSPGVDGDLGVISSSPALRDSPTNNGLAIIAWTYDNWVTHFMFALFGWMGMLFGGPRSGTRTL